MFERARVFLVFRFRFFVRGAFNRRAIRAVGGVKLRLEQAQELVAECGFVERVHRAQCIVGSD